MNNMHIALQKHISFPIDEYAIWLTPLCNLLHLSCYFETIHLHIDLHNETAYFLNWCWFGFLVPSLMLLCSKRMSPDTKSAGILI